MSSDLYLYSLVNNFIVYLAPGNNIAAYLTAFRHTSGCCCHFLAKIMAQLLALDANGYGD